ncbi:MAG TPA: hypothetical protein VKO18_12725 [Terriglobia bacterium]|nr:hypothetical protein [Terriglobia bacterium]
MPQSTSTPEGQDDPSKYAGNATNGGTLTVSKSYNPPPPPEHCNAYNHSSQPPWWKRPEPRHTIIQILLLGVGIYVAKVYSCQLHQMIESNRINREALESVQRAFIGLERFSVGGTGQRFNSKEIDFFTVTDHLENSGTTPAIQVVHYFRVQEFSDEPTEQDFLPKNMTITGTTYVSPKGTLTAEDEKPASFYIGSKPLETLTETVMIPRKICFLGLVIYYDVFENTKPHVTEFCKIVTGINIPVDSPLNSRGPIDLPYRDCKNHNNCFDQYCEDYDNVVKLARPPIAK